MRNYGGTFIVWLFFRESKKFKMHHKLNKSHKMVLLSRIVWPNWNEDLHTPTFKVKTIYWILIFMLYNVENQYLIWCIVAVYLHRSNTFFSIMFVTFLDCTKPASKHANPTCITVNQYETFSQYYQNSSFYFLKVNSFT